MKNRRFKVNPKKQIGAKSNTTLFIFVSFAAILSVVILGYLKLTDHGGRALIGVREKRPAQSVTPTPPLEERMKKQVREALPDGGRDLLPPQEATLYGRWYTHIPPEGIAEFTFKPGEYELVYVSNPRSTLRKYSKGRYNYDPKTGYMGLFPERGAKPSAQYDGVQYKIITMRNYQVVLSRKKGDPALYMRAHERDLAGKNYHPLFMYEAYDNVPVLEFMPVVARRTKE